jgi:hypothetical protein
VEALKESEKRVLDWLKVFEVTCFRWGTETKRIMREEHRCGPVRSEMMLGKASVCNRLVLLLFSCTPT